MKISISVKHLKLIKKPERPSSSNRVWRTKSGEEILVKNMSDRHLKNSYYFLRRRAREYNTTPAHMRNAMEALAREAAFRHEIKKWG